MIDCGMGLSNIASRINSLCGTFDIVSSKGNGMHAAIRVNTRDEAPAGCPRANTAAGMNGCRIVLVDDHSLFRNGLRGLLDRCEGCRVVAEAACGEEFLAMLPGLDAEVSLHGHIHARHERRRDGGRALRLRPELKIITLSMFGDENYYTRMVEAGARGFPAQVIRRSRRCFAPWRPCRGAAATSARGCFASLAHRMRTREGAAGGPVVGARTRDPRGRVPRFCRNQEIADELFISKRTVDKHRANILEKTGCKEYGEPRGFTPYATGSWRSDRPARGGSDVGAPAGAPTFLAAAAAGFRGGVFPRASCPQGARRRFRAAADRRAADGLWHE